MQASRECTQRENVRNVLHRSCSQRYVIETSDDNNNKPSASEELHIRIDLQGADDVRILGQVANFGLPN